MQTAHPCKGASSAPGLPDGHPTVPCIFTQKPPTVLSPVQREITKTSLPLHSFAFEYFLCSLGLGRPAPSPSGVPAPSPPGTPRSCAASRATGSTGLHLSRGLLAVNGGLLLPPICTAVPCPWSAAALPPGGQGSRAAARRPGQPRPHANADPPALPLLQAGVQYLHPSWPVGFNRSAPGPLLRRRRLEADTPAPPLLQDGVQRCPSIQAGM